MKKLAAVILALGLVVCAKKPEPPSAMEVAAEKAGRAAKARLDGRTDVKGLQIHESPAPAPAEPAAAAPVAPKASNEEEAAKGRVEGMMISWKASKAPGDKEAMAAAMIWGRGLVDSLDLTDFNNSVEGFAKFRKDKNLDGPLGEFAIGSTLRRVNGQEKYTVVDVTINGALYHMGVPDDANPIFWTF